MQQVIQKHCQTLQTQYDVEILFAIENGSRAWRMASKDSDYDVRFVYKQPVNEYIQIKQPKDVIEFMDEENDIDIVGFDIFKFLTLLSQSNPTTIEWLISDIVYVGQQPKNLQNFAQNNFNPRALYHHYKSMCKNNYLKYLKTQSSVTHKRYLYCYRGLINAKIVAHLNKVPPIVFEQALQQAKELIPEQILQKIHEIIEVKAHGKEKDSINNIEKFDKHIESFLKDETEVPDERKANIEVLNDELRRIILSNNE